MHSVVASFNSTAATFAPTGGIITDAANDAILDQANIDAAAASAAMAAMISTNLGDLKDNDSLSLGAGTFSIGEWKYKEDTLTLTGSSSDLFVFNVSGSLEFDNSQINLAGGALASNVFFNFLNAVDIKIGKDGTLFNGTISATTGSVDYHNPATFNGSIIAKNISLHSDFNMTGSSVSPVPLPAALPLLLAAFGGLGLAARRRKTA